ncbi:MAG TPA: AtpZ/AtpI family protein [Kofleriaceae bacterium]
MANEHPKSVTVPVLSPAIDPAARKAKSRYNALSASSVGLELGIAVIVGVLGGMWLDSYFHTTPWLMLLFLVFGLVAGFRNVLRAVERAEKAGEAEDREAGRA